MFQTVVLTSDGSYNDYIIPKVPIHIRAKSVDYGTGQLSYVFGGAQPFPWRMMSGKRSIRHNEFQHPILLFPRLNQAAWGGGAEYMLAQRATWTIAVEGVWPPPQSSATLQQFITVVLNGCRPNSSPKAEIAWTKNCSYHCAHHRELPIFWRPHIWKLTKSIQSHSSDHSR